MLVQAPRGSVLPEQALGAQQECQRTRNAASLRCHQRPQPRSWEAQLLAGVSWGWERHPLPPLQELTDSLCQPEASSEQRCAQNTQPAFLDSLLPICCCYGLFFIPPPALGRFFLFPAGSLGSSPALSGHQISPAPSGPISCPLWLSSLSCSYPPHPCVPLSSLRALISSFLPCQDPSLAPIWLNVLQSKGQRA